jgi:uncharacterized paraquat-inducible protein A
MPSGPTVILGLKIAVTAVSIVLLGSLVALAKGNYRLHGRLNIAFFVLTMAALVVFEALLRLGADVTAHMDDTGRRALQVHLWFAVPLPFVMVGMLYTGLQHRRRLHLGISVIFAILWLGALIIGLFLLPHQARS